MTRQTSIEAYHAAVESGLVNRRRGQVLEIIAYNGPVTANECWKILENQKGRRFRYGSRFSELREMDLIDEVETRDCNVTGRRCIVWEISGRSPKPLPKKPKTARQEIEELKAEIERLNKIIEKLTNDPQLPLFHVV